MLSMTSRRSVFSQLKFTKKGIHHRWETLRENHLLVVKMISSFLRNSLGLWFEFQIHVCDIVFELRRDWIVNLFNLLSFRHKTCFFVVTSMPLTQSMKNQTRIYVNEFDDFLMFNLFVSSDFIPVFRIIMNMDSWKKMCDTWRSRRIKVYP